MSTSTILRVKRRLEDNPQDAFVLTCKRQKLENEELSPSLFVFRGTVENQEHIEVKKLVPKSNPKFKSENSISDIIQKIRKERKEVSDEKRYEIVKYSRGLSESIDDDKDYNLVDLEIKDSCVSNAKFAYDLYVAAKHDFDISMLDDLVSIENYETSLVNGSNWDNAQNSEEELSDDSNDENNWRNDYPDEENSSIDEDDMIRAMERCDLDDLSSDTEEENMLYENESKVDPDDIRRYGAGYAKYKAKVLTQHLDLSNGRNFVHCNIVKEIDEESEDGYKEDSDDGFYYGQEEDSEQFVEQYGNVHTDDENKN